MRKMVKMVETKKGKGRMKSEKEQKKALEEGKEVGMRDTPSREKHLSKRRNKHVYLRWFRLFFFPSFVFFSFVNTSSDLQD